MSIEQVKPVLTRAQEVEQLEKRRAEDAKRLKQLKQKGITYTVVETLKGKVGFKINGMGMPKFFYKDHILMLVGDTPEAQVLRNELLQWIDEHPELTDKE